MSLFSCCQIAWIEGRDVWWHEEMEDASTSCYPVWVGAEDPLFMLYTRYIINIKISGHTYNRQYLQSSILLFTCR
jgi:hypothetical protein